MRFLGEVILWLGSAVLLVPALVLLVEAVFAVLPPLEGPIGGEAADLDELRPARPRPPAVVIVPAHDEAGQIEATVRGLVADLPLGGRLLVVADNCHDETADLARRAGAEVIERNDPTRVGKGYAISFALKHLEPNPPAVVVLVDADCRVSSGGLERLADAASRAQGPVQGEYLLSAPPAASPMAVVGALAFLVRNRVRPRGLLRLGLPCQLTGSGMAIPWPLLRDAPATGSNLVEDLTMGLELALRGHPPRFCPEVQISSELPPDRAAGSRQRRRWEHGQLQTLVRYLPRLLGVGVARGRLDLVALALDLAVPPLALLVAAEGVWLGLALLSARARLASFRPAELAAAGLLGVVAAVALAWLAFGRRALPFRYLVFVPIYLLWKAPIYLALAVGAKQKTWERTARGGPSAGRGVDRPPD